MVRRLNQMGELSKETIFTDGTKLEACANKYTFVWKKSVGKWEEKMFLKTMEEKSGFRSPGVTADLKYESGEGYTYLREQKQKATDL